MAISTRKVVVRAVLVQSLVCDVMDGPALEVVKRSCHLQGYRVGGSDCVTARNSLQAPDAGCVKCATPMAICSIVGLTARVPS